MAKYILARGKKPTPVVGFKERPHPTAPTMIKEPVRYLFKPMHPVEIPEDVDVESWVRQGLIVRFEDKGGVPKVRQGGKEVAAEPKVDEPTEPEPMLRSPLAERAGKVTPKAAESDEDAGADYEELSEGYFKCLHCGKIYKTEGGVIRHIESKHQ